MQGCGFASLLINSRVGRVDSLIKMNRLEQVLEFLPAEMASRYSPEDWVNKVMKDIIVRNHAIILRDAEIAYVKYYLLNPFLKGAVTFPVIVRLFNTLTHTHSHSPSPAHANSYHSQRNRLLTFATLSHSLTDTHAHSPTQSLPHSLVYSFAISRHSSAQSLPHKNRRRNWATKDG